MPPSVRAGWELLPQTQHRPLHPAAPQRSLPLRGACSAQPWVLGRVPGAPRGVQPRSCSLPSASRLQSCWEHPPRAVPAARSLPAAVPLIPGAAPGQTALTRRLFSSSTFCSDASGSPRAGRVRWALSVHGEHPGGVTMEQGLGEVGEGGAGRYREGRRRGRPAGPARAAEERWLCVRERGSLSGRTDVSCLWLAVGSGFHLSCLCTRRFMAALMSSLQNDLVAHMAG